VVGFGVGGPTDIPARFIADKLSDALGQRVFVENRPASGGIVATRDVIARPADGYTLLLCTHFEAINVAAYKDPGFKLSDLAPISLSRNITTALRCRTRFQLQTFARSSPTPRHIPAR
jgi:tripartite-type tricarboxylate transporter receptor subunit TctC